MQQPSPAIPVGYQAWQREVFVSIHNEVAILAQGKHHTAARFHHNQSMVAHLVANRLDMSLVSRTNCSEAIYLHGTPFH